MDFADLYARYGPDIFRFAYYLSGRQDVAEEIAAETFARALASSDRIRPGTVKAYLLAIARNQFLDWTRREGRTRLLTDEDLEAADPLPGPEAVTSACLDLAAVRDALQRVPEHERSLSHGDGRRSVARAGTAALGCSIPRSSCAFIAPDYACAG